MATANRATKSISSGFAAAVRPRYVCRTCKHQLLQREAQQARQYSSPSSRPSVRRSTSTVNEQRRQASSKSLLSRFQPPTQRSPTEEAETPAPIEQYVEATTWDGLEHVGHHGHWRDLPADPKDNYEPWLDPTTATPLRRDEFLSFLYISIVECLAHRHLGNDPSVLFEQGPPDFYGDMTSLKIILSSSGTVSHLEDPRGVLQKANEAPRPESERQEEIELSIPEVEEQLSGARFDFSDPLTFAIIKRFSQLTSYHVPDPLLNTVLRGSKSLTTFIDLLTQTAKPKPKRFAELLLAKQKKALDFAAREKLRANEVEETPFAADPTLKEDPTQNKVKKQRQKFQPLGPNVMIFPRRETEVDREMEVGRWKVIRRELENRGLPVYPIPRLVPEGEAWRKEDTDGEVAQRNL
ncbi:uncharacterized protein Z520_09739 [Fonsecaea multimorphosa CBS 102226]|uniref:Large ribosomal subunit protein mL50 n=1 Tax=Fonsecaea multimorphosa CBS 102226 TaxID=1442371 RepID=A0A0D2KDA0_9EURO|nr:uncharacterized protein Z520_09739 [Fonsecaea multimorphosa CBS 102226]KIX94693.1 hypothetical protein Z520_09739 [Fonsecaea multimorphosa CBS 102226]OAL18795.1 hypothetical protein AYO22_10124 [Fonsecaea multimorphosa]